MIDDRLPVVSVMIVISLLSVFLMQPQLTGYSVADGFKGTGMTVFEPISYELSSEGFFKITLENLFGERVVIKQVTVSINGSTSKAPFNEVLAQGESVELVVYGLEAVRREAYDARVRIEFQDRSGLLSSDNGLLLGIVK